MEKVTEQGYWMDSQLKSNLDIAVNNLPNDWDFVFLVSGSGMVRVGKSVLAQQIGYYVAHKMKTPFTLQNIVFSGSELIKVAQKVPKHSVIIYDEARGELDSKKTMENITKNLLDFFAECGMYNHCIICVLPDFFELNKNIALTRSDALINVARSSEVVNKDGKETLKYKRGFFEFYNRDRKKRLYYLGKKNFGDYGQGKRNFFGEFRNHWVINKAEYEKKKHNHIVEKRNHVDKFAVALKLLNSHQTQQQISDQLSKYGINLSRSRISHIINEDIEDIEG